MSPWSPCMSSASSRSRRRACRGRWTGHRHQPRLLSSPAKAVVARGTARRTLRCACPWRNIARGNVAPLPPGIAGAALASAITAWKISNFRNDGAQERTRTFTAVKPLAPEASASTNSTTWALGPVSKDRSHGCQIASSPSKYAVQRRPRWRIANPLNITDISRILTGRNQAMSSIWDRIRKRSSRYFGGSGFLGRNVVRALAKRDYRIRVAVRRPELAGHLQPLGKVGQIHAVQANLRYPASVEAAMRDASVAVNLVGILTEGGAQILRRGAGQGRGDDRQGRRTPSARGWCMSPRSAPTRIRPRATAAPRPPAKRPCWRRCRRRRIMRPSVLFGPEDQFTNRFAALARISPVLPLIGGGVTRMQPVYVGDVATAVADAVDGKTKPGASLRTRRAGSADHARDHGNHP